MTTFKDQLSTSIVIGDGAMGTYLYQMGIPVGLSYEELNVSSPDMIASVHQEYIAAGATAIQTNTYSAQREKLLKFGLEDQVKEINRAAVRLARQEAKDKAFVFGTVGSLLGGYRRSVTDEVLLRNYQEQMEYLQEESVDAIILETFYQLEELLLALRIAKKNSQVPVICQFAIEDIGKLQNGTTLQEAFSVLLDHGADVVGLNCRSGPLNMIRSFEQLPKSLTGKLSAFPNAGLPAYIDGEYVYASTPEYFGKSAQELVRLGARLVGGCCGTTPEHIRAITSAIAKLDLIPQAHQAGDELQLSEPLAPVQLVKEPSQNVIESSKKNPTLDEQPSIQIKDRPTPTKDQDMSQTGGFGPALDVLAKKRKTVIVELDPPKSLVVSKFMEGAHALKEAGADALTMADNSLAMTRMSNMALGLMVKQQVGIRPLVHIACRDRNLIGQQSHLMGLHALGIDHVLAITGDPSRFGDFPGATSVYDLSSFDLLYMIQQMNLGLSYSGKPLQEKSEFTVATAFNPNVRFLDKAVRRLERKISNGAHYVMTQPVYDHRLIEQIYEATQHLDAPIFLGIMPLLSKRNAEFLHNEVPGISLTDDVLQRMSKYEGEDARKQGTELAMELLETALEYFNGIYIMTPLMKYEMTAELTRFVLHREF